MSTNHRSLFALFALLLFSFACFAQAPALPEGLAEDPRLSWRPTLNATATVVADGTNGRVTDWRSGVAVDVPLGGRMPLAVAIDLCANDAGEWIGVVGEHAYKIELGDKVGKISCGRASGYSGISFVGLDTDPTSGTHSSLRGVTLWQNLVGGGVVRDIAFVGLTFDVWDSRPIMTTAHAWPPFGHVYFESCSFLAIPNDARGMTAKGNSAATWIIRGHGGALWHIVKCTLADAVTYGDRQGGVSEHFAYICGAQGDCEILDTFVRGAQLSAVYFASRFGDRVQLGAGQWGEAYGRGKLLIDNLTAVDCGVGGTFAVNITGGVQDVIVRNMYWRANLDAYPFAGTGGKWAGGAIQVYADAKVFELDPSYPVDRPAPAVGLGYSLEPSWQGLPMSAGVDALGLPWDGFGGARSLLIVGGKFEVAQGKAPAINLRDCASVTIVQQAEGVTPLEVVGTTAFAFGRAGVLSQCGKMGDGSVPAKIGSGWWQQARLVGRKPPSTWIGSVRMTSGNVQLSPAEVDSWAWTGK